MLDIDFHNDSYSPLSQIGKILEITEIAVSDKGDAVIVTRDVRGHERIHDGVVSLGSHCRYSFVTENIKKKHQLTIM